MSSNRRIIMLFVLTVVANCLGNLSSEMIKVSAQGLNRVCLRLKQQLVREYYVAKEKPGHLAKPS